MVNKKKNNSQLIWKNAKKIIATLYYYKSNYDYARKNLQATSKEEKKY